MSSYLKKIRPAIDSKIGEFQHYQYDAITAEELWRYCIEKKMAQKKYRTITIT